MVGTFIAPMKLIHGFGTALGGVPSRTFTGDATRSALKFHPLIERFLTITLNILLMPTVGFRFRAYAGEQTLRALKAQLQLACEVYNTLRWVDVYFYHRDGRGLTQNELRQLALDLRKQDEEYQQLYSQVVQEIADRFYNARQRFLEGLSKRFPRENAPFPLIPASLITHSSLVGTTPPSSGHHFSAPTGLGARTFLGFPSKCGPVTATFI